MAEDKNIEVNEKVTEEVTRAAREADSRTQTARTTDTWEPQSKLPNPCLLYTSDAADE